MFKRRKCAYVIILGLIWGILEDIGVCQSQKAEDKKQKIEKETTIKANIIIASNKPSKREYNFGQEMQPIMGQLKKQFSYKSYSLLEYIFQGEDNQEEDKDIKKTTSPTIRISHAQKGIFNLPENRFVQISAVQRDGRLIELRVEVLSVVQKGQSRQTETLFSTSLWVVDGVTFSIGGIPYEDGVLIVALTVNPKLSVKSKENLVAMDGFDLKPIIKQ